MDASKNSKQQITQMVNFILQEAHEKANEIRVRAAHDFNLERQMLVHNGKQRINGEYEQKERDREVQQRVNRSMQITQSRTNKMVAREELMQDLVRSAMTEIAAVAQSGEYPRIVKDLIVQGAIKMRDETTVEVVCRAEDANIVKNALREAAAAFKVVMKFDINFTFNGSKVLPSQPVPGSPSGPGVVLLARNGSVVCDNTLQARLNLVYSECLPRIRKTLFP